MSKTIVIYDSNNGDIIGIQVTSSNVIAMQIADGQDFLSFTGNPVVSPETQKVDLATKTIVNKPTE